MDTSVPHQTGISWWAEKGAKRRAMWQMKTPKKERARGERESEWDRERESKSERERDREREWREREEIEWRKRGESKGRGRRERGERERERERKKERDETERGRRESGERAERMYVCVCVCDWSSIYCFIQNWWAASTIPMQVLSLSLFCLVKVPTQTKNKSFLHHLFCCCVRVSRKLAIKSASRTGPTAGTADSLFFNSSLSNKE